MKLKIDMVVFDMAGTTVRDKNEVEDCFVQALEKTSLKANHDEINAMMGWSKRLVFETLWKRQLHDASKSKIEEKTIQSYEVFRNTLEDHYINNPVLPTAGCLELFQYLRSRDIKIALTTGFYRKVTDILLRQLGWHKGLDQNYCGDDMINASVSSDQVVMGRPSPFMIFRAMELCRVTDVKRVIKIGDTPSDLAEGKNAGCRFSLGVTNGTHTREALQKCENDGLLHDLIEFKTLLENYI
jgi:phosphonatase-like hydrolase